MIPHKQIAKASAHAGVGCSRFKKAAFSLVEVVMALGIVAIAFIPLIGLLPRGIDTMRRSIDVSAASQIIQQIGNEIQQSDFDALSGAAIALRYFDDQCREVPETRKADAIYQSQAVVLTDPANSHRKRAIIQVARNPGGTVTLQKMSIGTVQIWSKENALPVITRSLILGRSSSVPAT